MLSPGRSLFPIRVAVGVQEGKHRESGHPPDDETDNPEDEGIDDCLDEHGSHGVSCPSEGHCNGPFTGDGERVVHGSFRPTAGPTGRIAQRDRRTPDQSREYPHSSCPVGRSIHLGQMGRRDSRRPSVAPLSHARTGCGRTNAIPHPSSPCWEGGCVRAASLQTGVSVITAATVYSGRSRLPGVSRVRIRGDTTSSSCPTRLPSRECPQRQEKWPQGDQEDQHPREDEPADCVHRCIRAAPIRRSDSPSQWSRLFGFETFACCRHTISTLD